MRFSIKTNTYILLLLSLIALVCLVYIFYQVNQDLVEALNIYRLDLETDDYILGSAHIFILLYHIYAFIYLFSHFHHFKELKVIRTTALIIGIFSLFVIAGEKVMIDEIAREYRLGADISELYLLDLGYSLNAVFSLVMGLLLVKTLTLSQENSGKKILQDEKIFIVAQIMGIVSGIMGLFLTFALIGQKIPLEKIWVYIPFYILFLIPYGLAVFYWLLLKRKQKINEWYDEKQFQDILKASLVTMLLSIPGMLVLLFIKVPHSIYWFLYFIFLVIFLFSSCTLYFFKIKDLD